MPRNGSGTYALPQAPFSPGTTISSSAVNSDFLDIASAITGSVATDGQSPITGPFKFLDGSAATPSITFTTNTNDGLYHPGAGRLAVAVAGVDAFEFQTASAALGAGLLGLSGAVLNPIGIISDFAGSSAPAGWFLCFGQAISRTTYAELFGVIGTTYGTGDGSTTFNVPDLRGRITPGKDNMGGSAANRITNTDGVVGTTLGSAGGEQTHTLTAAESAALTYTSTVTDPGHSHTYPSSSSTAGGPNTPAAALNNSGVTQTTNAAATGITVATSSNAGGGAHNNLQPSLILNKIIFAGHP